MNKNIEDWVSDYSDDLFRWALQKTNNKEASEDLVQETFLAAFNSIDSFQGNSQPKTWLTSILKNKINDFHRKNFKAATITQSQLNQNRNGSDLFDNLFDTEGSWRPESRPSNWEELDGHLLDDLHFKEVFQNCIMNLPENWSSAIQFKYIEEKKSQDICQELGISSTNYWQILHRAKLQLRVCLEKNWFK